MSLVSGYQTEAVLFEDELLSWRRAVRQNDGARVALKFLKAKRPEPRDIALLRREFGLGATLPAASVLRPLALEPTANGFALVTDAPAGDSLQKILGESPLALLDFLQLGEAAATALAALHAVGVIHRSIAPRAIFWERSSNRVQLGDLRFASKLSLENAANNAAEALEGVLLYIAPEQTGRMNRAADHRADLYSLGATLYHALTGKPPFDSADPLELVHSHLARNAAPPLKSARGEELPPVVQAIVQKLLKKAPEERYQSATGLASDFRRAIEGLQSGGQILDFELGRDDFSDQLQTPQRLYGRDEALLEMADAFEAATQGERLVFVVAGQSGVGKTALILEMHKPIARRGGVFLAGKFDQYRRDQPYSAIAQALQTWVQRLLTEPPDRLALWKDRLLSRVGASAGALVEIIPELRVVLGDQPPATELPPTEAQNRLHHLFRNVIRALESPGKPLILFLDDLQWADRPTLSLLRVLMSDPDSGGIILFGAYRDNEVDEAHPLRAALEEITRAGVRVDTLQLGPLGVSDAALFLRDAIHAPAAELEELAGAFVERSAGVPFVMQELLRSLHRDGKLYFDREARRWRWDLAAVRGGGLSLDAVALVQDRIRELTEEDRRLLLLAACSGAEFNLRLLALSRGEPPVDALAALLRLAQAGLISPRDSSYKLVQNEDDSAAGVQFSFLHDRIQQGAYAFFTDDERRRQHLLIARTLLAHLTFKERDERIIEIVEHLISARELIDQPEERLQTAELALQAGRRARRASAYEEALRFFAIGADFLPGDARESAYELYIQYELELGAAYYVLGDLPRSEKRFQSVLKHARTGVEKLPVFETRVAVALGKDRPDLAVKEGLLACAELGLKLDTSKRIDRKLQAERLRKLLRSKLPEEWLRQPALSDGELPARLKALTQLVLPARTIASPLYGEALAAIVELSSNAISAALAHAMACAASFIADELHEDESAWQYGRAAIDMAEKLNAREVRGRVLYEYAAHLMHLRNPAYQKEETLLEAARTATENGDLVHAGQALWLMSATQLWTGCTPLDQLQQKIERHFNALYKTGQNFAIELNGLFWQCTLNLAGAQRNRTRLSGMRFRAEEVEQRWQQAENATGLFYLSFSRTFLSTIFGYYDMAVEEARKARRLLDGLDVGIAEGMLSAYQGIAAAGRLRQAPKGEARKLQEEFALCRKEVAAWAKRSEVNFSHLNLLLQAEEARLQQADGAAMKAYDDAIARAAEQGFPLFAALGSELCARYFQGIDKPRFAAMYLSDAQNLYKQARYDARASDIELEAREQTTQERRKQEDSGPARQGDSLDLLSVLKASQAISGELEFNSLLQRMLRIVIENVGAQRGAIALLRDNGLRIVAEGQINRETVQSGLDLSPEGSGLAPASMLRYVERTRQLAVEADAFQSGAFVGDEYIQQNRVRSALAYPLQLQGQLLGALYLENSSVAGAFTAGRMDALGMLAAQIASSLENARLYANLQVALEDERRARQAQTELTAAATRFVPSEFLKMLGRSSLTEVDLGQNIARELTVLFSDIRGFTAMSEAMTPQENFRFINSYLSRIGPIVREHDGFIDKYIGDAVMALFPDSEKAVLAALEMQRSIAVYNQQRASRGYAPIQVGIGLNTGELMLGVIGEANRMEGTVISDAVNLASRLEGLTKLYGAPIVLGERTVATLPDANRFRIRELDRVQVKGKQAPARIFELLVEGLPEMQQRIASILRFHEALQLYLKREFAVAETAFAALVTADPGDRPALIFRERCKQLKVSGAPPDWNGVAIIRRK